jgi:hypothetical protein
MLICFAARRRLALAGGLILTGFLGTTLVRAAEDAPPAKQSATQQPTAKPAAERTEKAPAGEARIDEASSPLLPKALETGARWLRAGLQNLPTPASATTGPATGSVNESATNDSATNDENQRPLPTPVAPSRLREQPEIEIEAARRHQQNLFQGSVFDSARGHVDDRAEFARALKKVAAEHEAAQAHEAATPLAIPVELPSSPKIQPIDGDVPAVTAEMRSVAHTLDEMAALREEAGEYAAADRLRQAAQRIRCEARELLHPARADQPVLHR